MIHSTSPSDGATGPNPVSVDLHKPPARPAPAPQDHLSTDQADRLHDALANSPEIRPEVVARGLALAADPGYPPPAVIQGLAGMILNSPDPSEDHS